MYPSVRFLNETPPRWVLGKHTVPERKDRPLPWGGGGDEVRGLWRFLPSKEK